MTAAVTQSSAKLWTQFRAQDAQRSGNKKVQSFPINVNAASSPTPKIPAKRNSNLIRLTVEALTLHQQAIDTVPAEVIPIQLDPTGIFKTVLEQSGVHKAVNVKFMQGRKVLVQYPNGETWKMSHQGILHIKGHAKVLCLPYEYGQPCAIISEMEAGCGSIIVHGVRVSYVTDVETASVQAIEMQAMDDMTARINGRTVEIWQTKDVIWW